MSLRSFSYVWLQSNYNWWIYSIKYPLIKARNDSANPPNIKEFLFSPVMLFPPRPYFRFSLNPDKVSVSAMKYFLLAPQVGHLNLSMASEANNVLGAMPFFGYPLASSYIYPQAWHSNLPVLCVTNTSCAFFSAISTSFSLLYFSSSVSFSVYWYKWSDRNRISGSREHQIRHEWTRRRIRRRRREIHLLFRVFEFTWYDIWVFTAWCHWRKYRIDCDRILHLRGVVCIRHMLSRSTWWHRRSECKRKRVEMEGVCGQKQCSQCYQQKVKAHFTHVSLCNIYMSVVRCVCVRLYA